MNRSFFDPIPKPVEKKVFELLYYENEHIYTYACKISQLSKNRQV